MMGVKISDILQITIESLAKKRTGKRASLEQEGRTQ